MGTYTLLIADSNEDFRRGLSLALQRYYRIFTCRSGPEALAILREEDIRVLVVDLMLPEMDGLELLETLSKEGIRPNVLAVSPYFSDYVLDSTRRLGIDFAIRKPCDIRIVAERVVKLHQRMQSAPKPTPREAVRQMLALLEINTKYDGYKYLMHILPMRVMDPEMTITKHLYPSAAKAFQCEPDIIERSIRNAIEVTWERDRSPAWDRLFPNYKKRPANGDLIRTLSDIIRSQLE